MGSNFNIGILKFHAYDVPYLDEEIEQYGKDKNDLPAKSIWWKGNEYKAWPYQITGIESSTDGTVATQRLKVSNIENSITPLFYENFKIPRYQDLLASKFDEAIKWLGGVTKARKDKIEVSRTNLICLVHHMLWLNDF